MEEADKQLEMGKLIISALHHYGINNGGNGGNGNGATAVGAGDPRDEDGSDLNEYHAGGDPGRDGDCEPSEWERW